ncbi:RES domain-containing protein [Paraconexibacter antarcticus]|uniref:RES domain-containing protein n=1 Tax=Paraconexibacter antarcticus TaxID=2949664 RepID=A0ABY5DR58_9ACTN|nr:RES family NAD+ phosphorylase [Paraconexibacter antarcticus]UTI63237.1 RES domain-containing protein [Paraconexibacter antarcticus]
MLDVDATYVSGTWWRHVPAGGDVFYEAEVPADNRWQRGEVVDAWYHADEPATVWAEWYRALAGLGMAPGVMLPRDLWAWELSVTRVADLSDAQRLARVGLRVPRPGRTRWSAFQRVGETLFAEGYQALIAPSAARPERLVVCAFRPEREIPGARPIPPPQTIDEPPTVPTGMTT